MKKIIMTGNPEYGICEAFSKKREATYVSRTSGMDLTKPDSWRDLAKQSLDYDVFINNSALWRMHQTLLLKTVYDAWFENEKSGLIICIGSTADVGIRGGSRLYPVEKAALRDMCRRLSFAALGGSGIRVSLLSPGYVNTPGTEEKHPSKNKISTEYVAEVLDWLIDQPEHLMFNEISLDPIQEEDQSRDRRIHDPNKKTK